MTYPICGLYFVSLTEQYLPVVNIITHTTILTTTSRTKLIQTFFNPQENGAIEQLRYTFPLYNGVSVVGFTCRIGDRTIVGQVKEREMAKQDFQDAVNRGERAALLEQLPNASDVFTTAIGNVPAEAKVIVEITYIGELKHDAEIDGIRFTIPTSIMPRYGSSSIEMSTSHHASGGSIQITVDVEMVRTSFIQQIQSPSHPISVSLGTTSTAPGLDPIMSKAAASLSLSGTELDKDFVIQVVAKDTGVPTAILETHPTIPNQRALMATLVPKFLLPPEKPEIVFICDRSESMSSSRIKLAKSALKVFLKSFPIGVKFNICSFGSSYSFLWDKSRSYNQSNLEEATRHVEAITANMGGTEMFEPIKATIEKRNKDISLEIMLLTDGAIWDQQRLFTYLNEQVIESKAPIRVFTLGIGSGASHALIEGAAKAGNGFSQSVSDGEKMDSKVVRMLKGALSPHVTDYKLEVKYSEENRMTDVSDDNDDSDDDFVMVEKVADSLNITLSLADEAESVQQEQKPISLFDTSVNLDSNIPASAKDESAEERYLNLPIIAPPKLLQAPHVVPPLYAFNRTSVYLLMGPECNQMMPKSVILRGTSKHGPLELEIPIQILDTPGETIHQLAAKKAIAELEQGRGWITQAKDKDGDYIKSKFESRFEDMVEREAVRLGVQFQIQGRWSSFIAVEGQRGSDMDQASFGNTTFSAPIAYEKEDSSFYPSIKEAGPSPVAQSASPRIQLLEQKRLKLTELRRARESRRASNSVNMELSCGSTNTDGGSRRDIDNLVASLVGSQPCSESQLCAESQPYVVSQASTSMDSLEQGHTSSSTYPFTANSRDYSLSIAGGNDINNSDYTEVIKEEIVSDHAQIFGSMRNTDIGEKIVAPKLGWNGQELENLIELQTFQGFWEWGQRLFDGIRVAVLDAEKIAKDNGWDKRIVATALAIAYMKKKLGNEKETWELVAGKAKEWLKEQIGQDGIVTVLQEAEKLIN